MSLAAVAAGADGLAIEVHRNPAEAQSDKEQALSPPEFADIMRQVRRLERALEAP
jgi:3-deoxy-7-phosphoheptulonate synthase